MKKVYLFALIFVGFFSYSFVSSSGGCCFTPDNGLCMQNFLQNDCKSSGGTFSLSPNCNSLSECSLGCCILGDSTKYATARTCHVESQAAGFSNPDWRGGVSQEQCRIMSKDTKMGACVFSNGYENLCQFVEGGKCSGTFHEGLVCSDPSLDTICVKTETTKCFSDGGVYFMDSCGNRDEMKQMCDYDRGLDCKQRTSKEAYCKDLNCVDKDGNKRTNGESWCIGLDGNISIEDVRVGIFKKPHEDNGSSNDAVGSESFKQICIDGQVVTEQCGTHRSDFCVPSSEGGGAACVANLGGECSMFSPDPENPSDESWKEECKSSEWCYVSRLDDCIKFVGDEGPVCGEQRDSWRSLPQAQAGTDLQEVQSELLQDLNILMCLPKISIGSDISSGSYVGEGGVCSEGDFEATTQFKVGSRKIHVTATSFSKIKLNDWRAYSESETIRWGNVGLISLIGEHWASQTYENIYCLEENPLSGIDKESLSWRKFGTWVDMILVGTISYACGVGGSEVAGPAGAAAGAACGSIALSTIYKYDVAWSRVIPRVRVWYGHCKKIKTASSLSVEPRFLKLLNARTVGLGDCAGSLNWAGEGGSSSNFGDTLYCKKDENGKTCTFNYESRPWSPPADGDCSLCGADDLPCTEYRCSALGKRCEYVEPRGIDSGACVSSNDKSPPTISYTQTPNNPIEPYSGVLVKLQTNEDSYCRFDFASEGGTMEGLKYDTDRKFGREHEFYLNVPGRSRYDEDIAEYPILTRDGKYKLFVRCEDAAGNYNVNAYIINLEVMDTPDKVPAQIMEFIPAKNSYVKFNTTTKEIKFRLNEPAECRWSFNDEDYDEMGEVMFDEEVEYDDSSDWDDDWEYEEGEIVDEGPMSYHSNQFICDTEPSREGMVGGYWCQGLLANITREPGNSTKFYIRCKDQPMLEGKEDQFYSRNLNPRSEEYTLYASKPLEISEVRPGVGDFVIGADMPNITYVVKTKNGAENGKAECKWRYRVGDFATAFEYFGKTNASNHEQVLTSLQTATYFTDIYCKDSAGNIARGSYELNIVRDSSPPDFARIYNKKRDVFIVLNEPANCKYVVDKGCHAISTNGTSMNSVGDLMFSTTLQKDKTYYFGCEDSFGNYRCFGDVIFR